MNTHATYTNSFILKNGEFFDGSGDFCKIISPCTARIDDWECIVTQKGIICTCYEERNNGLAILKYTIFKNGFSRLVLKEPNAKARVLKKEWLAKPNRFKFDGIVTLSNGPLSKRSCWFKPNTK